MTTKLYLANPSLLTATSRIAAIFDGDSPKVWLDQTLFHPQGGGQKADRGLIGGVLVFHVAHNEGEVDHFVTSLESLTVDDEVEIVVDEEWRSLNGRYHLAGHTIAALTEHLFPGLRAVSGHHWPGEARVEFEGIVFPEPERVQDALPLALGKAIDESLSVHIQGDPYSNRSIAIADFPALPCGGTHPENTGVLRKVEISKVKVQKGRMRISYHLDI